MRILVTGGAGFVGSALIRQLIETGRHAVLNVDKLTYAGGLAAVAEAAGSDRYRFIRGDICDAGAMRAAIADFRPDVIAHLAAESHVDRSIDAPGAFIQTNLVGTSVLLQEALDYWRGLPDARRSAFRFHHVSTDEVYGSLDTGRFTENTPCAPRSPYSASKAGADHLVAAWGHTYGLPVLISRCGNNHGPFQYPEKLIPLTVVKALAGEPLPLYGAGDQVRDWLFVDDHARALRAVFERGAAGATYIIGSGTETTNIAVVHAVCAILDRFAPRPGGGRHADRIVQVADRPGHDRRYALDASRIRTELGWRPLESLQSGLEKTVRWYLAREDWWRPLVAAHAAVRRGIRG